MVSVTNAVISGVFQPVITGGPMVAGLDYTASLFTWQNIKRLYARLYPLMMMDFVHINDYKVFVSLTKSHKHLAKGAPTTSPITPIKIFRPITKAILAATAFPEPWSGLPAKDTGPYGIVWEMQYAQFRNVAKAALKIDKSV